MIERETSRALAQVSETTLTSLDEGDPEQLMLEALDAYLQGRAQLTLPHGDSC